MSQLERIYAFHQKLKNNRFPNTRTLQEKFELSRATAHREVLQYGSMGKVLEPESLQIRIAEETMQMARQYKERQFVLMTNGQNYFKVSSKTNREMDAVF